MMGCLLLGRRKGQINSGDFLIGSILFVGLIIFMLMFWFVMLADMEYGVNKDRLEAITLPVSDLMVKGPGVPPDWEENPESLEVIGLAGASQNVLVGSKVRNFTALDYEDAKEIMGLEKEFHFYIEDLEGNRLYESGNATLSEQTISVTRFALLEDEMVRMRLIVHG